MKCGRRSAYTRHHEGDVFTQPLGRLIREPPCSRYVTARLTADNTVITGPYARIVTSQGAASRSLGVNVPGNSFQCSKEIEEEWKRTSRREMRESLEP
jgi:hypothetical protein